MPLFISAWSLLNGITVIFQFHKGLLSTDHAEINNGINLQRNVVASDDVLRRHIPRHEPKGNPYQLVNRPEYKDQSRPFVRPLEAPEAEDDRPFIFPQYI